MQNLFRQAKEHPLAIKPFLRQINYSLVFLAKAGDHRMADCSRISRDTSLKEVLGEGMVTYHSEALIPLSRIT